MEAAYDGNSSEGSHGELIEAEILEGCQKSNVDIIKWQRLFKSNMLSSISQL